VLRWARNPIPVLEDCARRFGDAFTIELPGTPPFVLFSDPEAIREIFSADAEDARAGEANAVLEPLVGPSSLLLLDGARHRRERRLLLPPFHGERMQAYAEVMHAAADRSMDDWPVGHPFAIQPRMQGITLEIILRAVFGVEDAARSARLRQRLIALLDLTRRPLWLLPWFRVNLGRHSPWGRIIRVVAEVDELLHAEIVRRRAEGGAGRADVLSMLLAARDESGAPMTDAELRDELVTLLAAGHETTATALAWTVHRLVQHPDVLHRARAEVDRVVGNGGRDSARDDGDVPDGLDAERIGRLVYLDAVIKETFRLHPVLPLVWRRLQRPLRIGGRDLPAGVNAAACIYLVHRRGDVWSHPERFLPDRFLDARPSPYEFLPFGGGVRRCIGMAFALFEMRVVLARMLRRFEVRPAPGPRVRTVRRNITLTPSGGMPVVVERRARA
jgi:cytochrome P450